MHITWEADESWWQQQCADSISCRHVCAAPDLTAKSEKGQKFPLIKVLTLQWMFYSQWSVD